MSLRGLPREKVLATVVHLLETTLIRVGNDEYAKANESYGLTTLKSKHVAVEGSEVRFRFIGKSGKQWSLAMRDRRVARIIRACQELPGQDLLQYFDDDKELRAVSSGDVNAYLREIAGRDITAKDFRTWAGTVLMARFLESLGSVRERDKGQARDKRRGQAGRGGFGKHPGRLPQVLYPSCCDRRLSRRRVRPGGRAGGRTPRAEGPPARGSDYALAAYGIMISPARLMMQRRASTRWRAAPAQSRAARDRLQA